jgi:hypothetical protein
VLSAVTSDCQEKTISHPMKQAVYTLLILCFVVTFIVCDFNSLKANRAISIGGPSVDNASSVSVYDKDGSLYVAGSFMSTITIGNVTFTASGPSDMFLVKYDADGTIVWAQQVSDTGTYSAAFQAITVDTDGNLYATGWYDWIITFGAVPLSSVGKQDAFLVKYDPTGNVLWARSVGSPLSDGASAVAVSPDGNSVYFAGSFVNTGVFDTTRFTSRGNSDIFLVKYDRDGVFQYAKRAGGLYNDDGVVLAAASDGSFYLGGYYVGNATFGETITPIGSAVTTDIFIQKFNQYGQYDWIKKAGSGTRDDILTGLVLSPDEQSIYITGGFQETAVFDTVSLTSSGSYDMFLAKYSTSDGQVQWAVKASGTTYDLGHGLAVSVNETIFVTGIFQQKATFGDNTGITGEGSGDGFIAAYDATGAFLFVKKFGGDSTSYTSANSIAVTSENIVYITGNYGATISFESDLNVTAVGSYDVFVTQYYPYTIVVEPEPTVEPTLYKSSSQQVDGSEMTSTQQSSIINNEVSQQSSHVNHVTSSQQDVTYSNAFDSMENWPSVDPSDIIGEPSYSPNPVTQSSVKISPIHSTESETPSNSQNTVSLSGMNHQGSTSISGTDSVDHIEVSHATTYSLSLLCMIMIVISTIFVLSQ